MTIQINDLLRVSERLHEQAVGEVDHRASISRSYYAAYHDCTVWHGALSAPGALTRDGGVHAQLIDRLQHPMTLQTDDKLRSKRRGYILAAMRVVRATADYELQQTLTTTEAAQSLANARKILTI